MGQNEPLKLWKSKEKRELDLIDHQGLRRLFHELYSRSNADKTGNQRDEKALNQKKKYHRQSPFAIFHWESVYDSGAEREFLIH